MSIRRILAILAPFCLTLSSSAAGQQPKKAIPIFDGRAAFEHVRVLSADAMCGRRSGHDGESAAAQYIASRFKEWGIEPAFPNGYIQELPIEYTQLEVGAAFAVVGQRNKREFVHGEDWRVQSHSGSGSFAAEVVFVGYGVHSPAKGYDDYAGADVKGKVVLFQVPAPGWLEETCGEDTALVRIVQAAQGLGARACIIYRPQAAPGAPAAGGRPSSLKEAYNKDFVILGAEQKVVDFIFKFMPAELRFVLREIDRTKKGAPVATGTQAVIRVDNTYDPKRVTRNVVGKITGSDRTLQNEYVVIGSHFDAVGWDTYGEINNGADDNASGTAVTMEIARALKLSGVRPKRTIVFGLWGGEEQGLQGSRFFCDNPPFPMDSTVVYFNMDMVGQGNGNVTLAGKYYGPEIWDVLSRNLSQEFLTFATPDRGGPAPSDHTPFLEKGVMAYVLRAQGDHLKYHQAFDEIDLIKPEQLKRIGGLCLESALIIADEADANFFPPMRREIFHFRNQTLVNFSMPQFDDFIFGRKDDTDSDIDLQLTTVAAKEGLRGDGLRAEIIRSLWAGDDRIKSTNLALFSSSAQVAGDNRQGKTLVMRGLAGASALSDDPRWAEILVKQGIDFALFDRPEALFSGTTLSAEGKKILEFAEDGGLLLIVSGAEEAQAKAVLEAAKKAVVVAMENIPHRGVLELAKKKGCAVGLIIAKGEDAAAYFKKLEEAKTVAGTESLLIVNEECLCKEPARAQILKVISEMLKAKYSANDMTNLFSGTFFRLLDKVKGTPPEPAPAIRPF
jgi:hypothetical protein